jgi:hypothetical protein
LPAWILIPQNPMCACLVKLWCNSDIPPSFSLPQLVATAWQFYPSQRLEWCGFHPTFEFALITDDSQGLRRVVCIKMKTIKLISSMSILKFTEQSRADFVDREFAKCPLAAWENRRPRK